MYSVFSANLLSAGRALLLWIVESYAPGKAPAVPSWPAPWGSAAGPRPLPLCHSRLGSVRPPVVLPLCLWVCCHIPRYLLRRSLKVLLPQFSVMNGYISEQPVHLRIVSLHRLIGSSRSILQMTSRKGCKTALSNRNTMWATFVIQNFLVAI